MNSLTHIPVLANEIEQFIIKHKPKVVIDCTLGGGGHAEIFLKHECKVIGFDYDNLISKAINNEVENNNLIRLKNTYLNNFIFIHDNFANIAKHITKADFIFADLGLSTMQIDTSEGFAFSRDTALNMCSDVNSTPLYERLKTLKYQDIYKILVEYGEVKNPIKIANNIHTYKTLYGINTTFDLIKAIDLPKFIPNKNRILAQIFQAFRIYNNQEMENLNQLLLFIRNTHIPFGMICYHSLESRAVKQIEKYFDNIELHTPTKNEIEFNPRSRSAIMRIGY